MLTLFVLTQTVGAESEKSDQFIVINKALNKLAFYEDGRMVHTYSVATGASAISTPEGNFNVIVKWECPVYYKTKTGGCVDGNPLGPRWIGLDVPKTTGYTYGIHGNSSEWSIGTYASAGCVRMHNWQVTELFNMVKMNTPVVIIRSQESFNQIAEANGYKVKKAKKVEEEITIFGDTLTYYGAHVGTVNKKTLTKQRVKVLEKIDGWFKVEVEDDTYWLFTENYLVGEIETKEKYLLIEQNDHIYLTPRENSDVEKTEKTYIIHSTEQAGEWQYVHFNDGKTGWVKKEQTEEVSHKDWVLQENMSRFTNQLLNELNDMPLDSKLLWNFAENIIT